MPDEKTVYAQHADKYEDLVAREDYQGNILRTLEGITPLAGRLALDLGTGAGRLACLLAPRVTFVRAFDTSPEMLRVATDKLKASGLVNWQTDIADHRRLPVDDHSVDLVVSGWSVSYLAVWNPDHWREELDAWLAEMRRVLRSGGFIVLFESLGTGNESPQRLPHLSDFYPWLDEAGFQNTWIRTDYKFDSPEQAAGTAGFFFGEEMQARILREGLVILPECTGVWWLKI